MSIDCKILDPTPVWTNNNIQSRSPQLMQNTLGLTRHPGLNHMYIWLSCVRETLRTTTLVGEIKKKLNWLLLFGSMTDWRTNICCFIDDTLRTVIYRHHFSHVSWQCHVLEWPWIYVSAQTHIARKRSSFLQQQSTDETSCSSKSSELNPIENISGK